MCQKLNVLHYHWNLHSTSFDEVVKWSTINSSLQQYPRALQMMDLTPEPTAQPTELAATFVNEKPAAASLILQCGPVRAVQIATSPNTPNRYLLFSQGCQLYHKKVSPVPVSELHRFQVFDLDKHISNFTFNQFTSDLILVVSKGKATLLKIDTDVDGEWISLRRVGPIFQLGNCTWVQSCVWITGDSFVVLSSQNTATEWKWCEEKQELVQLASVEYTVTALYSGQLYLVNNAKNGLESLLVCCGTVFGQVHVWNVRNGSPNVLAVVSHHQGPVTCIQLDLDSGLLVTTSDDRSAKLYRVTWDGDYNGQQRNIIGLHLTLQLELYGHQARVYQGLASRIGDEVRVVTSSHDGTVCVWEKSKGSDDDGSMEIARAWTSNSGSPVRALAYDQELGILYTGGDDGSVWGWNVGFNQEEGKGEEDSALVELYPGKYHQELAKEWGHPRHLILISNKSSLGQLIAASHSNELRTWNRDGSTNVIWTLPDCKCIVMKLSTNGDLAIGCSNGLVIIGRFASNLPGRQLDVRFQEEFGDGTSGSPISSLVWLSNEELLVSSRFGVNLVKLYWDKPSSDFANITALRIDGTQGDETKLNVYPKITAATYYFSQNEAFAYSQKLYLVTGDEFGVLRVFVKGKSGQDFTQTLTAQKWHSKYGISSLQIWKGRVVSTGHDCYVKMFSISNSSNNKTPETVIQDVQTIRTPFEWIHETFEHSSADIQDLICVGFHETKFVLYSLHTRTILVQVDCGGAHRSFGYTLNKTEAGVGGTKLELSLAYIRNKGIHFKRNKVFDWLNPIKVGLPLGKVNCAVKLEFKASSCHYFACGGEDTRICIFKYTPGGGDGDNCLKFVEDLSGHCSGLRALAFVPPEEERGEGFLVSGGGRSQLGIWKLRLSTAGGGRGNGELNSEIRYEKVQILTLLDLSKFTPVAGGRGDPGAEDRLDVRILDIQTQVTPDLIHIYASCSDGTVHVLQFDPTIKKAKIVTQTVLIQSESPEFIPHCVTKLLVLPTSTDNFTTVFGATNNGHMYCWTSVESRSTETNTNPGILPPNWSQCLTDSAITSCCLIPDGKCKKMAVVLGCDDGSLHLCLLDSATSQWSVIQSISVGEHMSTVSNIRILEAHANWAEIKMVTSSVDQSVAIWSVDTSEEALKIKCIAKLCSGVNDCQALLLLGSSKLICLGDGGVTVIKRVGDAF